MYYQKFFNAIIDLTGFTPLEGEMQELLDAAEKDRLISPESEKYNKMTTIEGNKIIAEFMAIKIERPHYLLINQKSETKTGWYQVDRMLYHASWNWLMPVYIKLKDISSDVDEIISSKLKMKASLMEGNIELLHSKIVELIKLHNSALK